METPKRTILKAVTWQLLGLSSMAVTGWFFTGSLAIAGSMAVVTASCGLVCYVLHERVWNRIAWGRLEPFYTAPY